MIKEVFPLWFDRKSDKMVKMTHASDNQEKTEKQTQPVPSSDVPAIEAVDLKKVFKLPNGGELHALKGVSLTVPSGQVFSILGPNGAGKTTLLSLLTSVTKPTSGYAKIYGYDTQKNTLEMRQVIGVVSQENHFDKYLTVWQNLAVHAQMHGLHRDEYEPRLKELLDTVGLWDRRMDYHENFSGGMQRRIVLIRSLIHKPSLLFLDEPTTGLDPEARRDIWHIINDFKESSTVVLTTHYMEEADRLSDDIMMMNAGTIVTQGTPQELKKKISPEKTFDIHLHQPAADQYLETVRAAGYGCVDKISDFQLQARLSAGQTLKEMLDLFDWVDIRQVGETQVDLETVYLAITGKNSNQAGVKDKGEACNE